MRALVIALNPSIDVEWRVPRVRWEEKNDVLLERRWPGGKGVNVARWFRHLGGNARLLLPLGGTAGRGLATGLRREKLPATIVPLRDSTRANVIVTTEGQGQLRFNPFGPRLTRDEWCSILLSAARELSRAEAMVLSGSLPRGVPKDAYAKLIALGHRAGVRTLLDCDGAALVEAAGARPFLVKPNVDELARWSGRSLRSLSATQCEAAALSRRTGGYVLVSLGAGGALLVEARRGIRLLARPPRARVLNTVGAGDALLAAVAAEIAAGKAMEEWLRAGVAAGTAAVACPAGELPGRTAIRHMTRRVTLRLLV